MSDIGFFTTADLVELASVFLLALIVPGAAIVRRLLEMRRAPWAGRTPEQIWRRLLAARIAEAPFWVLLGGGLYAVARSDSAIPAGAYAIIGLCLAGGVAQGWACARQTARGWDAAQAGRLGRRARRLAGAAPPPLEAAA